MKVAIVGSRNLIIENLELYLPATVTEIVSGGASGIDRCAKEYAKEKNLKLTEYLPEYNKYGRAAPIKRNQQIIDYSDLIIAFGTDHHVARRMSLIVAENKKKR